MPAKKKAAAKKAPARKGGPSTDDPTLMDPAAEPQQPHEVNSSLESDRMQALLADHRKMGSRP